jgi:hypothetical protein
VWCLISEARLAAAPGPWRHAACPALKLCALTADDAARQVEVGLRRARKELGPRPLLHGRGGRQAQQPAEAMVLQHVDALEVRVEQEEYRRGLAMVGGEGPHGMTGAARMRRPRPPLPPMPHWLGWGAAALPSPSCSDDCQPAIQLPDASVLVGPNIQ